uniref:Uncharacterized protein n=1 Tax=Arundo donax TaxID=35708 RepID=A0A0A9H9I4_ARUDO
MTGQYHSICSNLSKGLGRPFMP